MSGGFALGVRQTAIPLGAGSCAVVLPPLESRAAPRRRFFFLAGLLLAAALFAIVVIREGRSGRRARGRRDSLDARDRRLRRCRSGAASTSSRRSRRRRLRRALPARRARFLDGRGRRCPRGRPGRSGGDTDRRRAGLDRLGARMRPLRDRDRERRRLAAAALLCRSAGRLLVPVFILAGGLSMAWNGLSFTAAAELAGRARERSRDRSPADALARVGVLVPRPSRPSSRGSWQVGVRAGGRSGPLPGGGCWKAAEWVDRAILADDDGG